jgi:hypothetical protein
MLLQANRHDTATENSGEEIDINLLNPLYFFRSLISTDPASKTEIKKFLKVVPARLITPQ